MSNIPTGSGSAGKRTFGAMMSPPHGGDDNQNKLSRLSHSATAIRSATTELLRGTYESATKQPAAQLSPRSYSEQSPQKINTLAPRMISLSNPKAPQSSSSQRSFLQSPFHASFLSRLNASATESSFSPVQSTESHLSDLGDNSDTVSLHSTSSSSSNSDPCQQTVPQLGRRTSNSSSKTLEPSSQSSSVSRRLYYVPDELDVSMNPPSQENKSPTTPIPWLPDFTVFDTNEPSESKICPQKTNTLAPRMISPSAPNAPQSSRSQRSFLQSPFDASFLSRLNASATESSFSPVPSTASNRSGLFRYNDSDTSSVLSLTASSIETDFLPYGGYQPGREAPSSTSNNQEPSSPSSSVFRSFHFGLNEVDVSMSSRPSEEHKSPPSPSTRNTHVYVVPNYSQSSSSSTQSKEAKKCPPAPKKTAQPLTEAEIRIKLQEYDLFLNQNRITLGNCLSSSGDQACVFNNNSNQNEVVKILKDRSKNIRNKTFTRMSNFYADHIRKPVTTINGEKVNLLNTRFITISDIEGIYAIVQRKVDTDIVYTETFKKNVVSQLDKNEISGIDFKPDNIGKDNNGELVLFDWDLLPDDAEISNPSLIRRWNSQ